MTAIRPPRADELPRLRDIERAAGAPFVEMGMPDIAAHEPPSVEVLDAYRTAGRAWVAEVDDEVAAYVLVDLVDGVAHVEQVSVHPGHARQGIGRLLLDHIAGLARTRGDARVTLTTFREVPWNAPYYERCGYRPLPDDERGPELVALMQAEADHGLDPTTRVAMALDL